VLTGRVEELAAQVEAFVQTPVVDPDLAARVDELIARLDARPDTPAGEPQSGASDELVAQVAALEARISALADRPGGTAPAARSEAHDATGTGEISGREFDRLCFAVERLSLQLTEHHRAIDLLMNGEGAADGQLDALAARLDTLEARGVAPRPTGSKEAAAPAATGDGVSVHAELHELAKRIAEIDEASRVGREKLLTQIEQMMSSIDWRFQRLESGGKAA
jgi:BMFP domain-containing protein YqiC